MATTGGAKKFPTRPLVLNVESLVALWLGAFLRALAAVRRVAGALGEPGELTAWRVSRRSRPSPSMLKRPRLDAASAGPASVRSGPEAARPGPASVRSGPVSVRPGPASPRVGAARRDSAPPEAPNRSGTFRVRPRRADEAAPPSRRASNL